MADPERHMLEDNSGTDAELRELQSDENAAKQKLEDGDINVHEILVGTSISYMEKCLSKKQMRRLVVNKF